jgi:adenylate cyclase
MEQPGRTQRLVAVLRRMDSGERMVRLARAVRQRLPGDRHYGDPLSLAGDEAPQLIGRGIAAMADERPSALRELGMGALQVWQSVSEAQGRGQGEHECTIVFTDLVDFSDWVLEAGDDAAVKLVRRVGQAVEAPVRECGGRVVKRLGDGVMAVFGDPAEAVEAACRATGAVGEIYEPGLRAGVHLGKPRSLGGDFFGVDVNVAARVAAAAGPGQVLISETVRERLDPERVHTTRRWRFRPKGAPRNLKAFVAEPA